MTNIEVEMSLVKNVRRKLRQYILDLMASNPDLIQQFPNEESMIEGLRKSFNKQEKNKKKLRLMKIRRK